MDVFSSYRRVMGFLTAAMCALVTISDDDIELWFRIVMAACLAGIAVCALFEDDEDDGGDGCTHL